MSNVHPLPLPSSNQWRFNELGARDRVFHKFFSLGGGGGLKMLKILNFQFLSFSEIDDFFLKF
jgi:hypothetical protein